MDSQRVLSDRYAIISHLARGGMADVYVGHDQLLDRRVAVKILHPEIAASEAFVERFRREAQAAANLSHPNIVNIYDWGRDQGVYFMVMELIQGRDLRHLLRSEGALPPHRAAEIALEVATALGVAHERGLVHRDVKPANVLLTPEGKVKVTDFGIARAWDDSDQLTRTGSVIGTATYFSPEQAQGLPADARSDIYALGVVLYELLTGVPPFTGESPVSVAYQHVREAAPQPSDLNPNIPDHLDAIVIRCLEKDPRRRYQSAGAIASDLARYLAGQVPAAFTHSDAPTRMMQAAAGGPPLPPTSSQEGYRDPAYPEPGRPDRSTLVIGILAAVALLGLGLILLLRLLLPGGSGTMVTIPDLRMQERSQAATTLTGLGLEVDEEQVPDAEVPAGLVVGTDPPAGEEVEEGSTVRLLVSSGAGEVQVPRLIDATETQARALIHNAGLEVGDVTYEPSQVIEEGRVMSQSPQPEQTVAAGSEVDLVVSAGADALIVPDLTNRSERDALLRLAEAGFATDQIRQEREPSAEVLEGFVIETQPPAGATLPPGGIITVVISEGAVPTVVPNVVGEKPEDARAALEDLGFVVAFGTPVELEFGDPSDGMVAEQSPEGGRTMDYGSTVTLRVGAAGTTVPVPNVIGDGLAAARAAIQGAGLVFVQGADLLLEAGHPDIGKVAEVSPPVGTQIDPGDTVTVRIGVEGARVPNVSAPCLSPADAAAAIQAAGLVYEQVGIDDELPPGDACHARVVEQSPAPFSVTGSLVAAGSTVRVRIGQAMVVVPDVLGLGAPAARSTLQAVGLTWANTGCEVNPDHPEWVGKITRTDPVPGAWAPLSTTVMLFLGIANPGDACSFG